MPAWPGFGRAADQPAYLPLAQSGASTPTSRDGEPVESFGAWTGSAFNNAVRGDLAKESSLYVDHQRDSPTTSTSAAAPRLAARSTRRFLLVCAVLLVGFCTLASKPPASLNHLREATRAAWRTPSPPSDRAPSLSPASPPWQPPCHPSTWSSGHWAPNPLPPNASVWDASPSLGHRPDSTSHRCAQDFIRVDWYLGVEPPRGRPVPDTVQARKEWGSWPMSEYRERMARWRWAAGGGDVCEEGVDGPWDRVDEDAGVDEGTVRMLQSLIDRGGWLIVGDSLSEEHFFSLSCMLYPHVTATWPYPFMTSNQWQFKEEHLLLDPDGPLIRSGRLRVPPNWDYEGAPLISHVRSDHGFSASELIDLYRSVHAPSAAPSFAALYPALSVLEPHSNATLLLRDYVPLSPSLSYILSLFLEPASPRNISTPLTPAYAPSTTPPDALRAAARVTRSANYRALVFSTGAHFSARQFDFNGGASGRPDLEDQAPTEFFQLAMWAWVGRVAEAMREAGRAGEGKEVLIRPTNVGHDACHEALAPLKEVDRSASVAYNWKELWRMNEAAEDIVRDLAHPQVHFLDLNRPAALRPDAHTNVDCLHLAIGSGVVEGWTRFVDYWLRERARATEPPRKVSRRVAGRG